MVPEKRLAKRVASQLASCKWDVCDACDAWDNGFLKLAKRGAAPHATTKPFALTAMCKARAESQVLLTIGASYRLAPILEKNRIDN